MAARMQGWKPGSLAQLREREIIQGGSLSLVNPSF